MHIASHGPASVVAALCGCAFLALAQPARAEPAAGPDTADTAKATPVEDADALQKYGRLEAGIRAAARRDHIPETVVEALIGIFADSVDLQRVAQPGDGFVVVTERSNKGRRAHDAIVFAALTHGGQTDRFYRFAARRVVGYFDGSGRSADKLLVRRPIRAGILATSFGTRHHPILGLTRMHTGVDFEAARGTPIYATGPATVESAGWQGEYGRRVRLRHADGYVTAYAHMSGFARGIAPGARVRQGQLIGYVGSTGLSTLPHVHYEVLVHDRFLDPMRMRLPAQRVLGAAMLEHFDRRRVRLDADATRDGRFHAIIVDKS